MAIPWSTDAEAGRDGPRTFWDRKEGPFEDGRREARDVWAEAGDDPAPAIGALAFMGAVTLLLPTAVLLASAAALGRPARGLRLAAAGAGVLLVAATVGWMEGDGRSFGAGPVLALAAATLAFLGAARVADRHAGSHPPPAAP